MPECLPVLDTDVLAQQIGNDAPLIAEFLADFRRSAQNLAQEIRSALARRDLKQLGDSARTS